MTARSTNRVWASMRGAVAATALVAAGITAVPAMAQENDEQRIRKLEAEVRALQRRVFPGGDGRFFEPEITAPQGNTPTPSAAGSTTAVTDILGRLDALEMQLSGLTAQVEQNTNAVNGMEARIAALESSEALSGAATAPVIVSPTPGATTTITTTTTPNTTPAPAAAAPSPARLAAVQAIAKPQTDDPGDDEYSYGYRLWDAGFYPEAQQQLRIFLDRYPTHSRATYGRNLLGRAYLDDGKPLDAAAWFRDNYVKGPNEARGGDSLLFLAESMIAAGDTSRACIALSAFGDEYPGLATGRLRAQYELNRGRVTCS